MSSPLEDNSAQGRSEAEEHTRQIEPGGAAAEAMIGPYRLLEPIGHGGMGEVWLAEQKEPVRRRVAIKLIKAGMDTKEVVARFESERQTLALMDHPCIAKVFDAGSTPQGRPYFAMEYVSGVPINKYCDEHRLTLSERLELFIRVCEGVQHAHQKAIIHRDLKPSNILVGEVDGRPLPRIIDFGVAKAILSQLPDETVTMFTRVGAIVGTPAYMSPEQADSAGQDVDTRTDVHALGVVLYELLVGALPHDFRKVALEEIPRRLREQEVPRPSTKLRTLGEQSTSTAENRRTDPPTLTRQIRGDLDAITLKALEKERSRRYATPSELASDIDRYLRHETVIARPASVGYRARKYIRRHRIGVAVAVAALLVLASFAVNQTVQLQRIKRERDRADRVTTFMTGMFKISDPSEARGNDIRVREVLDKASQDIETGLTKEPELEAQMMYVMGQVYESLGLYSKSEALLGKAIEIDQRVLGVRNETTLTTKHLYATVLNDESRYPEAEKLTREILDARRSKFGSENIDTFMSMNQLALALNNEGRFAEAEKLHRQVSEAAMRIFGPQDHGVGRKAKHDLAIDLAYEGKFAESEQLFRELLENDRRALGPDHPEVLKDMNNLAAALQHEEKWADAEKLYMDALPIQKRVIGPEHPLTLMSMGNLAAVLVNEKRYADSEKLFRDTLAIKRRVLGPEHRSTLVTMGNLADTLIQEGQYTEAERLIHQTLEAERRTLGHDHSDTLTTLTTLGHVLKLERRYGDAEKSYRDASAGFHRSLGDSHPDTADAAYGLAGVLALEEKRDEALSLLQEVVDHLPPSDLVDLESDRDFTSLRGDPSFLTLVAHAKERAPAASKTK